jgi:hypothetical protein
MCIECHETDKAFRMNDVVFSKRKLREFFPQWEANAETFWRYLLMMPFFAETKEASEAPTKVGYYAIAKAKRLQKAIGIYDHAIPAFMIMAAEMGNVSEGNFNMVANMCHDHVCDCGVKKSPRDFGDNNVVDLRSYPRNKDGKTLN